MGEPTALLDGALPLTESRMAAESVSGAAERTFDLATVGSAYDRATRTRRRAMAVLSGAVFSFAAGASSFLFLWGLLLWPQVSTLQLLAVGLAMALAIGVAISFPRTARREFGDRKLLEAVISPSGEVTFHFQDGRRRSVILDDPFLRLRISDFRTTQDGVYVGAVCLINPAGDRIPVSGAVCDAIVETARARGLRVTMKSEPIASLSGRPLGRAVYWDIRGTKGALRQIWRKG